MAAPNIRNPSILIGKTAVYKNVPTGLTAVLVNGAASGEVYKINSIFAANTNGASFTTISISLYGTGPSGTNDHYLASTINVPPDATQIISTKETYFYLEEGWSIRAFAGNANYIDVIVSYEKISNTP
jgi:hypothetical protein